MRCATKPSPIPVLNMIGDACYTRLGDEERTHPYIEAAFDETLVKLLELLLAGFLLKKPEKNLEEVPIDYCDEFILRSFRIKVT